MRALRTGLLVIALILVLLSFIPVAGAAGEAPPSGYSYMKTHTIQGSPDGNLTDYYIELVVHRGMGTDSGRHVYLNQRPLSWPEDIRFTDSEGFPLSYWIESSDTSEAVVWVKLGFIPQSPGRTFLRIYYGKVGDSGDSESMNMVRSPLANEPIHRGWSAETAVPKLGATYVSPVQPVTMPTPTQSSAGPEVAAGNVPSSLYLIALLIVGLVTVTLVIGAISVVLLVIVVIIDQLMNP